ncbi:MAG: ABC transporter permease [Candidatus Binataceae bacterium]
MLDRIRHMLVKEFIQMLRDPKTRFVLYGPPLMSILVFGYAATFELHHVRIAALDLDHSYESREFLSHFAATPYFDLRYMLVRRDQIKTLIDRGDAVAAIQIHPGFARLLRKGQTAPVQVIVDGSNSNTALIAFGYINQIARSLALDYARERLDRTAPALAASMPSVVLEQRPWFNTNLDSRWFFIPGLTAAIVLISVVQLTAFSIVHERELGTLEQIMVTPISRFEFILGKTVPSFMVGLCDTALMALVGTFWFGVPFRGSLLVLMLGAALFVLSTLGIGLLISTISTTQQQAMVTGFLVLMPAIILSGLTNPISSMPASLQIATNLDPLRHFVVVLRGVYLKGIGIRILWPQMAAMMLIGAALLTLSVLRFRKSLD